jgi:hypothetical protein
MTEPYVFQQFGYSIFGPIEIEEDASSDQSVPLLATAQPTEPRGGAVQTVPISVSLDGPGVMLALKSKPDNGLQFHGIAQVPRLGDGLREWHSRRTAGTPPTAIAAAIDLTESSASAPIIVEVLSDAFDQWNKSGALDYFVVVAPTAAEAAACYRVLAEKRSPRDDWAVVSRLSIDYIS